MLGTITVVMYREQYLKCFKNIDSSFRLNKCYVGFDIIYGFS